MTWRPVGLSLVIVFLVALIWWVEDGGPSAVRSVPVESAGDVETPPAEGRLVPGPAMPPAVVERLVPDAVAAGEATTGPEPALDPDLLRVRVTGRVLDGRGRPFPGVLLSLIPEQATLLRLGLPVFIPELVELQGESSLVHATSGADGRFDLYGVRLSDADHGTDKYGNPQAQQLLARAAGLAWHAFLLPGRPSAPEHDLGDLVMDAGEIELRGRFVDEAGAPVAGVLLFVTSWNVDASLEQHPGYAFGVAWHRRAVSDAEGRATLRGLWPGGFQLRRAHADYLVDDDEELFLRVAPGAVGDLGTLVMLAGNAVSGRVLDAGGSPLPGAEVYARDTSSRVRDLSLVHVPPRDAVRSAALLPAWLAAFRRQERQPLSGIKPARTDADGFFMGRGLRDATADLMVAAAGHEPLLVTDVAVNSNPIELRLLPAATAELSVLSAADGRPLTAARVVGRRHSGVADWQGADVTAVLSPADPGVSPGTWRLTGLGPLSNEVEVTAAGYATEVLTVPGVSPGEHAVLRVELQPGASVSGRLVDAQGQPVFRAQLVLTRLATQAPVPATAARDSSPPPSLERLSDAAGAFLFEGLSAGRFRLAVEAAGHLATQPLKIDLSPTEARTLDPIVLGLRGAIAGVVLSPLGTVAAGVTVRARFPEGAFTGSGMALTHADGRFVLSDLAPGDYVVTSFPGAEADVVLAPSAILEVVLRQRSPPRLHGTVTAGGEAVEGVLLRSIENRRSTWRGGRIHGVLGRTDAAGQYDVAVGDAGLLVIEVRGADAGGTSLPVQLDWGDERRVDFTLGTAAVVGRVEPLPVVADEDEGETSLVLVPLDQDVRRMTCGLGADGQFRFGMLHAGRYRLLVVDTADIPGDRASLLQLDSLASTDVALGEGETRKLLLAPAGR